MTEEARPGPLLKERGEDGEKLYESFSLHGLTFRINDAVTMETLGGGPEDFFIAEIVEIVEGDDDSDSHTGTALYFKARWFYRKHDIPDLEDAELFSRRELFWALSHVDLNHCECVTGKARIQWCWDSMPTARDMQLDRWYCRYVYDNREDVVMRLTTNPVNITDERKRAAFRALQDRVRPEGCPRNAFSRRDESIFQTRFARPSLAFPPLVQSSKAARSAALESARSNSATAAALFGSEEDDEDDKKHRPPPQLQQQQPPKRKQTLRATPAPPPTTQHQQQEPKHKPKPKPPAPAPAEPPPKRPKPPPVLVPDFDWLSDAQSFKKTQTPTSAPPRSTRMLAIEDASAHVVPQLPVPVSTAPLRPKPSELDEALLLPRSVLEAAFISGGKKAIELCKRFFVRVIAGQSRSSGAVVHRVAQIEGIHDAFAPYKVENTTLCTCVVVGIGRVPELQRAVKTSQVAEYPPTRREVELLRAEMDRRGVMWPSDEDIRYMHTRRRRIVELISSSV